MGNAAQTQQCLATPAEPPCLYSTPFSPTLQGSHHGSPERSPIRHLRRADHVRGMADQRADHGGRRLPPQSVFTRFHPRGARSKPRIPRVVVELGAGASRAAAPQLSHRRRRVRASAAAATRRYHGAGAHTRGASARGAARGAPKRGPLPHRLKGWPPRTRRCYHAGRGGGDAAAPATIKVAATGRPHARIRAASTEGTRWRGRGPAAAGGRVGRAPILAGPHTVGEGVEAIAVAAVRRPTVPHHGKRRGRQPAGRRRGDRASPLRRPPRHGRRRQRRRCRRGGGHAAHTAAGVAYPTAAAARAGRHMTPTRRHRGGHNRRRRRRRRRRHRRRRRRRRRRRNCRRRCYRRGHRSPLRAGARPTRGRSAPTASSAAGAAATPPAAVAAAPTRRTRVCRA